jgi:2-hydroxy-3-oxopropionate reductase
MSTNKALGFIGLGIMGKAMTGRLLEAGYSLTVYDVKPSPVNRLVKAGAVAAGSAREVAEKADTTFITVPDSPDVEEVVLGEEGVLKGAPEGATLIITSTISPEVVRKVAEEAAERGVRTLDVGLSGGEQGVKQGTLVMFVGGEESLLRECLPLLEVFGSKIFHVGGSGHGMMLKLVNNLMAFVNLEGLCEGLVLGMKSGLDPHKMLGALAAGSSHSAIMDITADRILGRRFKPPSAKMSNAHKTLRIILDAATQAQVPLPATSTVYQLMMSMKATGRENLDISALITVLEDISDFEADGLREE